MMIARRLFKSCMMFQLLRVASLRCCWRADSRPAKMAADHEPCLRTARIYRPHCRVDLAARAGLRMATRIKNRMFDQTTPQKQTTVTPLGKIDAHNNCAKPRHQLHHHRVFKAIVGIKGDHDLKICFDQLSCELEAYTCKPCIKRISHL